jgi:hypothetical protein
METGFVTAIKLIVFGIPARVVRSLHVETGSVVGAPIKIVVDSHIHHLSCQIRCQDRKVLLQSLDRMLWCIERLFLVESLVTSVLVVVLPAVVLVVFILVEVSQDRFWFLCLSLIDTLWVLLK